MQTVIAPEEIQIRPVTQARWLRGLVLTLLALSIFFRLFHTERKIYVHDEVYTSLHVSGGDLGHIKKSFRGQEIAAGDVQKYQHILPRTTVWNTLRSVALYDAQHPPIFSVAARLWAEWVGDAPGQLRMVPALISLLAFPCLYWLCMELFALSRTAWIAMALMAVSPFHLLYAQEMRTYSLWTVAILMSSAALLSAVRHQTWIAWGLYTATVALGMWSHTLYSVVVAAHMSYMVGILRMNAEQQAFSHLRRTMKNYAVATTVGLATFLPWVWVIFVRRSYIIECLGWLALDRPLATLAKDWVRGICSVFVDWSPAFPVTQTVDWRFYLFALPVLALCGYSLFFMRRSTMLRVWLLPFALIGATLLFTAVPDLFFGGSRSGQFRYAIPCYLGLGLSVPHLIATNIASAARVQRYCWQAMMVALILGGAWSCLVMFEARTWWNKGDNNSMELLQAAHTVNDSARGSGRPLIISPQSGANFGFLVALSHMLDSEIHIHVQETPTLSMASSGYSDIFLFRPSPQALRELEHHGVNLVMINNQLYRVHNKKDLPIAVQAQEAKHAGRPESAP